ncbi:MAG: hypothetical protein U0931_04775 [Vulcanimicrobiota bacterium]
MRPSRRYKGFVLAAVFFIMVVIILLIASLFRLVPQEVRWTGDHRRETFAYYTCTGGIKHALAYLRQVRTGTGQTDPYLRAISSEPYESVVENSPSRVPLHLLPASDNGQPLDTYFPAGIPVLHSKPGRIRLGADWNAEVWIFPDKNTAPHPFMAGKAGKLPPCYIIVSAAFRDANGNGICDTGAGENYALRAETSLVEHTFARYAYFVDRWKDDGPNTTVFRVRTGATSPIFAGPVHSNDTPVIDVPEGLTFWAQNGFPAPFGAELSFSGDLFAPTKGIDSFDGVGYFKGNFLGSSEDFRPYRGSADPYRADDDRYKKLFRKGQSAIQRTSRLELPNDWSRLAAAAWGDNAGREVAVGAAQPDQVYVNTSDLGIVSTGALRELRLDIVDNNGRSTVFNNQMHVANTANSGHQVVNLQQLNEITYLRQEAVDVTQTITETGPYTMDQTLTSDTPLPGYSPAQYEATIGTTPREVVRYVQTGVITIADPPGGGGPASGGGGTISIPQFATATVTINVPEIEIRTHYIQVTTITGDGPHDVLTSTTETQDVTHHYAPQDAVVAAVDGPVRFPVNYFLPASTTSTSASTEFPVFEGSGPPVLDINVPTGKSLIVKQDRETGGTFSVKLVDGVPKGVIGVFGQVDSLRGVNRGSKTIFAADLNTPDRLRPTSLANVTVTDHLLHFATPPGSIPSNGDHALGLIAANITLASNSELLGLHNTPSSSPLFLYAALFAAEGSFQVISPAAVPRGEARIIGGVLQKVVGPLIAGGRGWNSQYLYDNFLNINPPPIFPPDGRFDVTFYRITGP